jgi:sulfhydrogenase subunit gamma (sulfur reductase)
MKNPYIPFAMTLEKVVIETDDKNIKTFVTKFRCDQDECDFQYLPGQFAMLSVLGVGEAAFGIASSPTQDGRLDFTVNKIGKVTTELHNLATGDLVWIRGPFGNHYPLEEMQGKDLVIIGGGYAFTTLRSLLYYILHDENREKYGAITVIYGARTPGLLLYKDELKDFSSRSDISFIVTIDKGANGWNGYVGVVPKVLEQVSPCSLEAYAIVCGPPMMIKYTLPVVNKLGFPSEKVILSLERKMKCGVGMCGRCNIGGKYVCKDGPVFTLQQLEELGEEII